MTINGNEIRPGHVILHKNRLWIAVKTQHTQPGKGGAYMQVELKDLKNGSKLSERFRAGESVERVRLEEKVYQYLFSEGDLLTLMHPETFEQITISRDLLGDAAPFLQDDMELTVCAYDGEMIRVTLPDHVTMKIVEAEPVVKGQTASSSYKPARLENGSRILVPPHIETGTRVVVNTQDGTYVERAR